MQWDQRNQSQDGAQPDVAHQDVLVRLANEGDQNAELDCADRELRQRTEGQWWQSGEERGERIRALTGGPQDHELPEIAQEERAPEPGGPTHEISVRRVHVRCRGSLGANSITSTRVRVSTLVTCTRSLASLTAECSYYGHAEHCAPLYGHGGP